MTFSFIPRRPLDDDDPDGYFESDRDFVLNNLEWCVEQLENHKQTDQGMKSK